MPDIEAILPFVLLVFGLLFGSFGNVVVWRLPRNESVVSPGSHCPGCGSPVRWHDNIPVVSWLVLRGKCRDCSSPISARYPLVETLSGILWFSAGVRYGATATTAVAVVFFYLLLLLSFIDLDTMRLPNVLVFPMAGLGILATLAAQLVPAHVSLLAAPAEIGSTMSPIVWAVIGAALGAIPVFVLGEIYGRVRNVAGLGFGDVKLLGAMGLFLGPLVVLALFFGSLIGSIAGAIVVAKGADARKRRVPFGPFLAAGGVFTALVGPSAWSWYIGLLG